MGTGERNRVSYESGFLRGAIIESSRYETVLQSLNVNVNSLKISIHIKHQQNIVVILNQDVFGNSHPCWTNANMSKSVQKYL